VGDVGCSVEKTKSYLVAASFAGGETAAAGEDQLPADPGAAGQTRRRVLKNVSAGLWDR
jgi:hypothetical protein